MGKVIAVTGGNKGIGLAIVESLLQKIPDSVVLLGSRDPSRGKAAIEGVVAKLGSNYRERVKLLVLDVTSEDSVKDALTSVKQENGTIHGLINNAGSAGGGARDTVDLNTYGVRRVCEAFAPIIEDGGRIVQVSSGAAPMFVAKCNEEMKEFCVNKEVTWEAIEEKLIKPFLQIIESLPASEREAAMAAQGYGERKDGDMAEYGLSKAAVNCYTMELARRFPSLTITSCTPGFIETDLTREMARRRDMKPKEMGMLTVEEGAVCPVYLMTGDLASLPGFSSGWYFGSDSQRSPLHKYRSPGAPPYQGEFP